MTPAGGTLVTASDLLSGITPQTPGLLGTVGNTATNVVGQAGAGVAATGTDLSNNGLAGLPVAGGAAGAAVDGGDALADPLAKVSVVNDPIIGSNQPNSSQLINASVLSTTGANNAVIGANVLSHGQLAGVAINTAPLSAGAGSAAGATPLNAVAGVTPVASGLVNSVGGVASQASGGLVSASVNGSAAAPGTASGGSVGVLRPVTGTVSTVVSSTRGLLGNTTNLLNGVRR